MTTHPIPDAALDDRLGWVGTAGSGKTYNAGAGVERLLARGARCVIVDPLDVWYGLRLQADGKTPSPYPVVIFGGAHGDLPLNEHAGKLIGETVSTMSESCIVSLGGLPTKAAERRFMLSFLETLYRQASGEPFHLIFDEADLWAPQKASEPMLQNLMEQIVRRGRVKGFIPWLITQRPAVISKDVLSQVDGLVTFKLTASQDRDALGAWIEGQADKQQGKQILASLPAMQRGQGIVWVPARGILTTATFPAKKTFDSSCTPKRGEKVRSAALAPIDLGKLKERLATVEAETKANDPKVLRKEIADLKAAARKAAPGAADPKEIEAARAEGYQRGKVDGYAEGLKATAPLAAALRKIASDAAEAAGKMEAPPERKVAPAPAPPRPSTPAPKPAVAASVVAASGINGPQQRILDALAWWESVSATQPTRVQVAVVAGYSPDGGAFQNPLGALRTSGLIEYPRPGHVMLTESGRAHAHNPGEAPTSEALHAKIMNILDGPRRRILAPLLEAYPSPLPREDLATAAGYQASGGAFQNPLGALRSLGLIDYPERGHVVALPILFVD